MSRNILSGSLASGQRRWTLTLALVLAMLIPAASAFAAGRSDSGTVPSAPPPTVAGDICVEGTVIDWNEEPLTEGWIVFPTAPDRMPIAGKGPELDDDDEATNMFEFNSDDDGLYPGDWTFTIDYSGLEGNWEPVEPYAESFTIPLEANGHDCYQIRFKLREVVEVFVYKIDSHHKLLDDWEITAHPAPGNYFASEETRTTGEDAVGKGLTIFRLTPGEWIFTEAAPEDADFDYLPIIPDDGRQELTIKSAADDADNQPYVIRFKNLLEQSCIEVTKIDEAPSPNDLPEDAEAEDYFLTPANLAGWEMRVLRADGSEATFGYTDANGYVKFSDLPPGPYTVVEEDRPGWTSVGPSEYEVMVVNSESCNQVAFVNKQVPLAYTLEGRKLDANGHFGIPGWEITIEPLSKNGYTPDPDSVLTNGLGEYSFTLPADDYRVPGSAYRICEEELDGWLAHTPICYTIHIPHKPGTVTVPDFVNQQVGHTESGRPDGPHSGNHSSCSYHSVRAGESLFGIGSVNGVSPQAMLNANSWVRDRPNYYLRPGDSVCIPH